MQQITPLLKSELALMYNPMLTAHGAVNCLMNWIKNEPRLTRALADLGYRPRQKYFTRDQVEAIFKWLGKP